MCIYVRLCTLQDEYSRDRTTHATAGLLMLRGGLRYRYHSRRYRTSHVTGAPLTLHDYSSYS